MLISWLQAGFWELVGTISGTEVSSSCDLARQRIEERRIWLTRSTAPRQNTRHTETTFRVRSCRFPDRPRAGLTTFAATDPGATLPQLERLRPPTGAPNVLIVLLDDVGFGASSAFGGPVHTPTAERL